MNAPSSFKSVRILVQEGKKLLLYGTQRIGNAPDPDRRVSLPKGEYYATRTANHLLLVYQAVGKTPGKFELKGVLPVRKMRNLLTVKDAFDNMVIEIESLLNGVWHPVNEWREFDAND